MSNTDDITIIPILVTDIGSEVEFIALIDDTDGKTPQLQRKTADEGVFGIADLIREWCSEDDYVYLTLVTAPGKMERKVEVMEDPLHYKRIFEDYQNGNLQPSYASYIRDFKLSKLIKDDK